MRFLTFLILSLSPIYAQNIKIAYGKVEKAPPMSICMDGAKHVFSCSNLRLKSKTINLAQFIGKYVKAEGKTITSLNKFCITMTVLKVTVVSERLEIGGNWTPGGSIKYSIYSKPGNFSMLFFSKAPRVITALGVLGTFYLNPKRFFDIGFGIIPGSGVLTGNLQIPNLTFLKNLKLIFQPFIADPRNITGFLANAWCVQIK